MLTADNVGKMIDSYDKSKLYEENPTHFGYSPEE